MKQAKKFLGDVICSISAIVLLNGVLQLVVYPLISRRISSEAFGNVLYIQALLSIFAASLGSALNNTRLVMRSREGICSGDFFQSLLVLSFPALLAVLLLSFRHLESQINLILLVVLFFLTACKNYTDVEYRLSLQYHRYFLYYAVSTVGYLVGLGAFQKSGNWLLVFLVGEAAALFFGLYKGTVYRAPFQHSPWRSKVLKNTFCLGASYMFYNAVVNLDRVMLTYVMGGESVTIYYVASLMGKMIALVVGPLNSVAISYLSKDQGLTQKKLFALCGAAVLLGGCFYVAAQIATPLYVRVMYPTLYEQAVPLSFAANLAQILCFSGSLILTMVLTVCSAKWQLAVQGGYAVLYVGCAWIISGTAWLEGFAWAAVAVGLLRLVAAMVLGLYFASKSRRRKQDEAG